MTLYTLIHTLKNISKSHALVNEFGEGDVYEYMNSGEHKYPCVFLTMNSVLTDTTSTNYNFTLFYIDRLTDDSDNKVNVQSMGISIIKQIVSRLIVEEPVLETSSIECTPFTEKFADYCGGAFATITVTDVVDNTETESDECSENDFEGKTITLTKNGLYDIIGYDKAIVSIPFETLVVEEEGVYTNEEGGWNRVEVAHMANVQENVTIDINDITSETFTVYPDEGYDGIGEVIINNYTGDYVGTFDTYIGTNGYYEINPADMGLQAFDKVNLTINCPAPTPITITEDGTYEREGGYNPVVVNTPKYEIISLNQKQYNELPEYNEYAVYLITYDNTIPSVEGDYFYIEAQEDNTELTFLNNEDYADTVSVVANYNTSDYFEVSTNSHDWYKLYDIAEVVEDSYNYIAYKLVLKKFDRLFIRNIKGEVLSHAKKYCKVFTNTTKPCFIGGDLNTLLFKYTDRITEIPYNTFGVGNIHGLFSFTDNLVDASDLLLPATTIHSYCYYNLFNYCKDLVRAPKILPAMSVPISAYKGMFEGCTSLTEAPELPATEVTYSSYEKMFYRCTSLETAPELPAVDLPERSGTASGCYSQMFLNCSNLNYVKCLAKNNIQYNAMGAFSNTSPVGTFVKHPEAEWVIGYSGIPEGWTIENANIEEI